jgi:scyllo-inositol 2-dehydrogenase (NADP+)
MDKIRVGIIGQGRSGYSIHAHSLSLMQDRFAVTAVADEIEERTKDAVQEFGCDAYTDYKKLLARTDLDLVVNASYSYLHAPISIEALEAGHNVLCEKPMAATAADADAMIAKAKETGKLLALYQQSRFAPYFQKVRNIIASGIIGRVVQVKIAFNGFARRWDWQTLQDYRGGNLLNTGPHPLDQALQLFGTDTMPDVLCIMDRCNTFGDAEDHVKLILRGTDRPTIDLEISSCDPYPLYTYHVLGTRGGITGKMTSLKWKYYKEEEAPKQALTREPLEGRAYCREDLPMHEETWEASEEEKNLFDYMAKKLYGNLYDALTKGSPLEVTPDQVRQQIAVIEECHRQNPLPTLK